jgi:hypothetical protein
LDRPDRVDRLILMGPGGVGTTRAPPTKGLNTLFGYYGGEGPSREKLATFIREYLVYDGAAVPDELIDLRYEASLQPEVVASPPLRRPSGPTALRTLWRMDFTRDRRLARMRTNEAALGAARDGRAEVRHSDLTNALEKIQLGTARNVVMPETERRRTAYHEGGHALLGMLRPGADPVRKVSIIPRGRALGVTLSTPETDRYGYDEAYLRGRIVGALGGMAAEQEVFGLVTTGAESDLETATRIARSMVGRWGMSDRIGPVSVLPPDGDARMSGISDSLLGAVDEEARKLIEECYVVARRLLAENRHRLDGLAGQLLSHETLDEPEAYAAAGFARTSELPEQLASALAGIASP